MSRLIECVPNFSEGRDPAVIEAITATIEASEGINLLDVDPGFATHRTVVTFVGEPERVLDAAVAAAVPIELGAAKTAAWASQAGKMVLDGQALTNLEALLMNLNFFHRVLNTL